MRLASIPLAALLVLSASLWVTAQAPDSPGSSPPPPASDQDQQVEGDRPIHPKWNRGHGPPMNEQQVRDALEVLRKIDPEKADKLAKHLDENPERVGRALHENFPNLGRFLAMRRYDPEGFDLRIKDLALSRQSQQSARRLHEAQRVGDDELAAAELAVLEGIVADHFDVRQEIREHELMKLEGRIEELQDQLQQRAENRDELIEDRLEEFVKPETQEGVRW